MSTNPIDAEDCKSLPSLAQLCASSIEKALNSGEVELPVSIKISPIENAPNLMAFEILHKE